MEKKFNVGDRVRFTRDYDNECVSVDKGDCGAIERIDANFILITLDSPEYVRIFDTDYIEPITSTDHKTSFLSELKGLLEKYGACIYDDEQYKLIIEFNNGDSLGWKWSNKTYDESKLTPDNIMDYDKE